MKLAFCLYHYFPYGGLQRDFIRIARACIARGHEIDVYAMEWVGPNEPGLRVHLISTNAWQNHTKRKQYVEQLQPLLQAGRYDAVVGFNKMPGLDVYYAADTCYQAKVKQQRYFFARWTARYRDSVAFEEAVFAPEAKTQILLIAEKQQAEFEKFYQTPATRFHLLPPGIDKDRVASHDAEDRRHALRKYLGLGRNALMLLMVGSGFKTKGLDRCLRAFAALPAAMKQRTHFYIVGKDHPEQFQLLAKKLRLLDKVHFLGGRDDVADFLLAADVLLHPAYNENTGTVLLEAVVSGLPVLTTDVCGYAHYIQKAKAGCVLTSPFDQAHMNHVLHDMLHSKERKCWRQNGLDFAHKADIYSMPEHAVQCIESCV